MPITQNQLAELCQLRDEESCAIGYFKSYKPDADVFERMAFWAEVQARTTLRMEEALLKVLGADELPEVVIEETKKVAKE